MATQKKVLQSAEHDGLVNFIEFSRDGRFVATASVDGTAKVWELPDDGAELEENAASVAYI